MSAQERMGNVGDEDAAMKRVAMAEEKRRTSKERRGEDDGSGGEVGWRRAGTRSLAAPLSSVRACPFLPAAARCPPNEERTSKYNSAQIFPAPATLPLTKPDSTRGFNFAPRFSPALPPRPAPASPNTER